MKHILISCAILAGLVVGYSDQHSHLLGRNVNSDLHLYTRSPKQNGDFNKLVGRAPRNDEGSHPPPPPSPSRPGFFTRPVSARVTEILGLSDRPLQRTNLLSQTVPVTTENGHAETNGGSRAVTPPRRDGSGRGSAANRYGINGRRK